MSNQPYPAILDRDRNFYWKQGAIVNGTRLIAMSSIICTKPFEVVEMILFVLLAITYLYRIIYIVHGYKSKLNAILLNFNNHYSKEQSDALTRNFIWMIEGAMSPLSIYMDLLMLVLYLLSKLIHVIYTESVINTQKNPNLQLTESSTNVANKDDAFYKFQFNTKRLNAASKSYNPSLMLDNKETIQVDMYRPNGFITIFSICLTLHLIIFAFFIFVVICKRRKDILNLIKWGGNQSKHKKETFKNTKRNRIVNKVKRKVNELLENDSQAKFKELIDLELFDDKEDEAEYDSDNGKKKGGKLLNMLGEDVTKLSKRDGIIALMLGENVFYGFGTLILIKIIDIIGSLTSGYAAGTNYLHAEFIIVVVLSIILCLLVMYTFIDIFLMGARDLIYPYLIFLIIPIGIIIELTPNHINRIYIDVMCGFIIALEIFVSLPLHYWKTTSEFIRRYKKVTTSDAKKWNIQNETPLRDSENNQDMEL